MKLSKSHWKFIIIKQGAVAILINFFMNGLMARVVFKPAESVSLWGEKGFPGSDSNISTSSTEYEFAPTSDLQTNDIQ